MFYFIQYFFPYVLPCLRVRGSTALSASSPGDRPLDFGAMLALQIGVVTAVCIVSQGIKLVSRCIKMYQEHSRVFRSFQVSRSARHVKAPRSRFLASVRMPRL